MFLRKKKDKGPGNKEKPETFAHNKRTRLISTQIDHARWKGKNLSGNRIQLVNHGLNAQSRQPFARGM